MDLVVLNRAYFNFVWDVPILVTPICIVRRSRSLPDDSESCTNKAPDLVDLADLNDLTSSKSAGTSGNSIDKQDPDADEEADQFEDASPLTPVHSPKKKGSLTPPRIAGTSGTAAAAAAAAAAAGAAVSAIELKKLRKGGESRTSEKSSPGGLVPEENSPRDLLLFTDGIVPVVNVTILREVTRDAEPGSSIVEEPGVQTTAPISVEGNSVKHLEIEREEVAMDFTVYDTGPSTSTSIHGQERRKSIKRQGSLVKEKDIDGEITRGKIDDPIKQKVAAAVAVAVAVPVPQHKVPIPGSDDTSTDVVFTSANITTKEVYGERRKIVKSDVLEDETARKLTKDRRKSLKEQKSIERVNEYLAKHSAESSATVHDAPYYELVSSEKRRKSLKEIRAVKIEKSPERRQSLAVDMGLMKTSSERRKSLTKQERVEIIAENGRETVSTEVRPSSGIVDKDKMVTEKKLGEYNYCEEGNSDAKGYSGEPITTETETAASTVKEILEDAESGRSISRRSSMKKKRENSNLSDDEDETKCEPEDACENGKREVTIRENVEEIFYEDNTNEEVVVIPEVQLVRAKIISAEEAAANLAGRVQYGKKIELNSPPEIVTANNCGADIPEKLNFRTKFRKAALSAEDHDEGLLNLPVLTKSTSENILVETADEENTISGKNFKPDILLDLSKVHDDEIPQPQEKPENPIPNLSKDNKRVLSRVGSEGSKISLEAKTSSRISTSSFIVSAVPPTRVGKDKSEMTSTWTPNASLGLQDKESTEFVTKTATEFRPKETSDSEQPGAVLSGSETPSEITVPENIRAEESAKNSTRFDSEPEPILSSPSSGTLSDPLDKDAREIIGGEGGLIGEKFEENKREEEIKEDRVDLAKPEVVTKTVYKSDFPVKKNECSGYKSVNQRLREREFSCSFIPKTEKQFVSRVREEQETLPDANSGRQRTQQILTTDKEAEEQRQKALEKQREHEKFLQNRRSLIKEGTSCSAEKQPIAVSRKEENLIGKKHSLEYQSQTLVTRSEEIEYERISKSSENLSFEGTVEEEENGAGTRDPGEVAGEKKRPEEYTPVEKREAETQTQQETKSTQCGTDEAFHTGKKSVDQSLSSLAESPEYFGSPRKEVETQTQGETKGTQCGPDDLAETFSQLKTFFRQKSFNASLGPVASPRREVEVQTEQESKSVQCSPEDIPETRSRSSDFFQTTAPPGYRYSSAERLQRREAEVQTYQGTKATQFSGDDLAQSTSPKHHFQPIIHNKLTLSPESSVPSTALYTSSPIIVLVDGRSDMTVTHNYKDKDGNVVWAKHWGPERLVEIHREPKSSLGLSIVGGKVDLYHGGPNTSQNISGIFIKNVLPNSPAGRTGDLKTGDRIIEVDGIDLRNSTHDRAVKAIQAAGNPVCLLVQSLVHLSPDEERSSAHDTPDDDNTPAAGRGVRRQGTRGHGAIVGAAPSTPTTSFRRKPPAVSPARTITPELIQEGIEDEAKQGTSRSDYRRQSTKNDPERAGPSSRRSSMKQSLRKKAPSPPKGAGILREVSEEGEDQPQKTKPKYSSDESSDEEDTRDLEGNVYTKAGIEISRKSAGNVKRTKEEIEADEEPEDEFGYTAKKIKKRYDALGHPVVMVKLEKDRRGLGISLAGHKDRNRMAVFVCGLNPKGVAHKTGGLHIGDEILEVNGTVLQGRCHLNASAMIKGMAGTCFKVIVLRRSSAVNDLAVKPIVQFPPTLDEDDPNRFSQYKGVRTVSIKKGQYGLGIMIIEGKHAEVGQGIFVSDIQEGSAAEQAGLQVGDMILAVNLDSLLGSSYDEATGLLKKTEGVVTLTVCNPNQSKLAKEEEDKAKGDSTASNGDASKIAKEPEKPKEPEPPKDPKDCEISVGRETTIEFPKDKDKAIGLTITGGSGTPLGGIVILEVLPEGAAGKDGRLKPGDQIIEMCHESFKTMEHAKAHEAILKASGPIHMVVFRDDKPPDEFDVEISKKSGKGVGLCLTGFKSGKGAYVSDMLPAGSALESGKIAKGDRVVGVGGQDVRDAPVEDIALHVKVSNPVQLKLARYKSVKQ